MLHGGGERKGKGEKEEGEAGHLKSVTWPGLWEGGRKSHLKPKPGHRATAGTRAAEPLPPRGWEAEGPSGAGTEE